MKVRVNAAHTNCRESLGMRPEVSSCQTHLFPVKFQLFVRIYSNDDVTHVRLYLQKKACKLLC